MDSKILDLASEILGGGSYIALVIDNDDLSEDEHAALVEVLEAEGYFG